MPKKPERYSLLRDAYAIIAGIPDTNLRLEAWNKTCSETPECNTIACAAGWLCLHPQFQALGLHTKNDCFVPLYGPAKSYTALADLFGISLDDAVDLFCMRGRGSEQLEPNYEEVMGMTDKELWMYRVRTFLKSKGETVNV